MRKLFLLSLILCGAFLQSINIKLLKGTHSIASSRYSPVMGISFLEGSIAQQWYKFSPKYQVEVFKEIETKNSNNRDLANLIEDIKRTKKSATENLISEMYHISGGSFAVTNASGNPVKYLKPNHIGKILHIVQKLEFMRTEEDQFSDYKDQAKGEAGLLQRSMSKLNGEITKLKQDLARVEQQAARQVARQADPDDVNQLRQEISNKESRLKLMKLKQEYLGKVDKCKDGYDLLKLELTEMLITLNIAVGTTGKQWSGFVTALIDSLKESDSKLYPENTTQGIILSYLLAKSNTREDLQEYFRGLLDDTSFILRPEEYTNEEITQILAGPINAENFEEMADLLTAYTYKIRYGSFFPKVVENKTVSYHGLDFSDCMETTIRMLVNILSYKQEESKVGIVQAWLQFNAAVQGFYDKGQLYKDSAEVGNILVHQSWVDVISNVSGCIYKNIINDVGETTDVTKVGCNGFIPVNSEFEYLTTDKVKIDGIEYDSYDLVFANNHYPVAQKTVGDETYILIPNNLNLYCCEMRSYISNVITSLNYVFNLNLYSNINEIFDPSFASEKFTSLCTRLNWATDFNISELDNPEDILNIPIHKGDTGDLEDDTDNFTIHVLKGHHGYITINFQENVTVNISDLDKASQAIRAALLSNGIKAVEFFDQLHIPLDIQLYKNINVLNILDESTQAAINNMIDNIKSSRNEDKELIGSYLKAFLIYLAWQVYYYGDDEYNFRIFFQELLLKCIKESVDLNLDLAFLKRIVAVYTIVKSADRFVLSNMDTLLKYAILNKQEVVSLLSDSFNKYTSDKVEAIEKLLNQNLFIEEDKNLLRSVLVPFIQYGMNKPFAEFRKLCGIAIQKHILSLEQFLQLSKQEFDSQQSFGLLRNVLIILKNLIEADSDAITASADNLIIFFIKQGLLAPESEYLKESSGRIFELASDKIAISHAEKEEIERLIRGNQEA